jgi:hypothetical protein
MADTPSLEDVLSGRGTPTSQGVGGSFNSPSLEEILGGPTGRPTPYGTRPRQLSLNEMLQRFGVLGTAQGFARNSARGIPVLGNFIEGTNASQEARNSFPVIAGAGQLTAATGLTALPFSHVARGTAAGLHAIGGNPNNFLAHLFAQGATGAGINAADVYTSDSPSNASAAISGALGAGGAGAGTILSRAIAPSGIGRNRPRNREELTENLHFQPPGTRDLAREVLNPGTIDDVPQFLARDPNQLRMFLERLPEIRGQELSRNVMDGNAASWIPRLVGGAVGHYSTGDLTGLMAGMATGEVTRAIARRVANTDRGRRYLGHQLSPEILAIINSLGSNVPISVNRPNPVSIGVNPNNTLTGQ